MNVGVFHVQTPTADSDLGYQCGRAMVRSVRIAMPRANVVHFTDLTSKPIKGVDVVRRKPSEPMALLRMRHHAGVSGDWLFVDTDVIVQRSVRLVFKKAFDVAICRRDWPHLKAAVGFTETMPFNTGVMFSRCPRFWGEVYTRLREFPADLQQWMGDQQVICDMLTDDAIRYDVAYLRGSQFNYPPPLPKKDQPKHDTEAMASIVHYKGPARKSLLLARLKKETVTT